MAHSKTCNRFLGCIGHEVALLLKRPVSSLTFEGQGFTTQLYVGRWKSSAIELIASAAKPLGPCTIFWCFGFNDHKKWQVECLPEAIGWAHSSIDAAHVFVECDDGQECALPEVGEIVKKLGRDPVSLPWPADATVWAKHHWPSDRYHMCHAGLSAHWRILAGAIAHAVQTHGRDSGPVLLVADSSFTSHDYAAVDVV